MSFPFSSLNSYTMSPMSFMPTMNSVRSVNALDTMSPGSIAQMGFDLNNFMNLYSSYANSANNSMGNNFGTNIDTSGGFNPNSFNTSSSGMPMNMPGFSGSSSGGGQASGMFNPSVFASALDPSDNINTDSFQSNIDSLTNPILTGAQTVMQNVQAFTAQAQAAAAAAAAGTDPTAGATDPTMTGG